MAFLIKNWLTYFHFNNPFPLSGGTCIITFKHLWSWIIFNRVIPHLITRDMTKLIINAPFGNIKPLVNLELLVNLEDGGLIGYRPHQMMMRSKTWNASSWIIRQLKGSKPRLIWGYWTVQSGKIIGNVNAFSCSADNWRRPSLISAPGPWLFASKKRESCG